MKNNVCKPIYEFLMWDNCNNNCKFCFQRKSPRNFTIEKQSFICDSVVKFIKSNQYTPNNHVLIVGGEIFDNIKRYEFLYDFFDELTNMMVSRHIDLLYLNTNLLYNETCFTMLKSILELFLEKNVIDRLKFTTSYDLEGRFKTQKAKELFLRNLNELTNIPSLHTVTNLILTKNVCEAILEDKFNIFNFQEKNHTQINMIPYIIFDQSLTAPRDMIFNCLRKIDEENPEFIKQFLFELDMKQPRILLQSTPNGEFIEKTCMNSGCGHSINFKKYSSSNSCFVCDIKTIFNKYE